MTLFLSIKDLEWKKNIFFVAILTASYISDYFGGKNIEKYVDERLT